LDLLRNDIDNEVVSSGTLKTDNTIDNTLNNSGMVSE
jgi:hypothetical protein